MEQSIGWEDWQLETLDSYILGYTEFENQQELAEYVGKSLNAVKVKISRRREQIEEEEHRKLSIDEYLIILANRFDKETREIASLLNLNPALIIKQMDEELDCLECKEFLERDFKDRVMTNEEHEIFMRLYYIEKKPINKIAHILNRDLKFVRKIIEEVEQLKIKYK